MTVLTTTHPCPCTLVQQDDSCPVGYPSLLCDRCDGKGHLTSRQYRGLIVDITLIYGDGQPSPRGIGPRQMRTVSLNECLAEMLNNPPVAEPRQQRRQRERLKKKGRVQ